MAHRSDHPVYLYAVVFADRESLPGKAEGEGCLTGIEGLPVYRISRGPLATVVSDLTRETIRPERKNLAAHQGVLKSLMGDRALLPMGFGMIADHAEAVKHFLAENEEELLGQLKRVEGNTEMGLRVVWDTPNIFEYLVDRHPELRERRDQLFREGRQPSRDKMIDLGRLFDKLLREDRDLHTQTVVRELKPRCVEILENASREEREVMNLACLVRRDGVKEMERSVLAAAKSFDNNFAFDLSGPWPPYNFARVELKTGSLEHSGAC
jgi:hypothetical protein